MGPDDDRTFDVVGDQERRAPEPLFYTPEQLVGRAPIRLRRRSDRRRLAAHLLIATALLSLVSWWVLLPHVFAGPVVLSLTPDHGVHLGDLPSLLFGAVAGRSLLIAGRQIQYVSRGSR